METGTGKLKADVADIESCVSRLEQHVGVLRVDVDHIKRDLSEARTDLRGFRNRQERDSRVLLGAMMLVALGMAVALAKGFGGLH